MRLFFFIVLFPHSLLSLAHQTPNSVVLLSVNPNQVRAEIQIPLAELELAFGRPLTPKAVHVIERYGLDLKAYLLEHIHVYATDGKPWIVTVNQMRIDTANRQAGNGVYKELVVNLVFTPPQAGTTRKWVLDYTAVMHQVWTHKVYVSIVNDWQTGKINAPSQAIGIIQTDPATGQTPTLKINLDEGSTWKGFLGMLHLGMEHISEGTDHLLFLLVLLLPIPLTVSKHRFPKQKWGKAEKMRTSLVHILKVVTAFTLGHSITLLIGAMGWEFIPTKTIEILIGFSILISAIHALHPLFAGKESYIAFGFGLIHGLAFANTLQDLHLDTQRMVLSILGFNIGIEIMQLVVILATIPWLILMSRTAIYPIFRVTGAILAAIAAMAWIMERYTQEPNKITESIIKLSNHAFILLGVLILLSLSSYFWMQSFRVKKE